MGSVLSNTFKVSYAGIFLISFIYVFTNIDQTFFDFGKLLNILDYLIAIFQIIVTSFGNIIAQVVNPLVGALHGGFFIPLTDIRIEIGLTGFNPSSGQDPGQVLTNILTGVFPTANILSDPNTDFADPAVIADLVLDFIQSWSVLIAFILIPAILLSFFGFILRGEARLAIISFVSLQILVVLAMYTPVDMTNPNVVSTTGRMMMLDLNFPTFTGTPSSFFSDLVLLIQAPVFMMGILLYLLLEIAFQTSYAINVIDPMIDRERRIKEHLARIDSFQPQPEKDKKTNMGGLSSTTKKYDIVAASYLREMVERKVFKKGQQVDQKTTLRLQSFIKSTRATDRNFVEKITAKSAQPNTSNLLLNAVPSILFRVIGVVILAFLIINPTVVTDSLITTSQSPGIISFPQLADSLELTEPEFRTVIIFNLVLLILFISAVGHWLLVNRPEVPESKIKKVETLVDFQDIKEQPVAEES